MQEVDWDTHPAEGIVALTTKNKYVVKRSGLGLHDYGLVDAAAAKRHAAQDNNAGGASSSAAPPVVLTEALINEFEGARKAFEKETVSNMTARELDLGIRSRASCTAHKENYG